MYWGFFNIISNFIIYGLLFVCGLIALNLLCMYNLLCFNFAEDVMNIYIVTGVLDLLIFLFYKADKYENKKRGE